MDALTILAQDSGIMDRYGLYLLPLVGSVMLTYALFSLVRDLRKVETHKVSDRLLEKDGRFMESAAQLAAKKSILREQKNAGSSFAAQFSRFSIMAALQRMLDQANILWSATTMFVNLTGLAALSFIGGYFLKLDLWISLAVALACFLVPLTVLFFIRKRRLNKFLNQLPDVFELMSSSLRAGHSLANAIFMVSEQLPDPIKSEFARVFHEQDLGIKIEDALMNMANRINMMDVSFFVTAVAIQRQTGGDLAEVLDNISGVIRERIKLFGMVKALTAEGRLSGWVLLALPIGVFFMEMFINPSYASQLTDTEIGRYMLISAGIAQLLGLVMIQKIVNIKV